MSEAKQGPPRHKRTAANVSKIVDAYASANSPEERQQKIVEALKTISANEAARDYKATEKAIL